MINDLKKGCEVEDYGDDDDDDDDEGIKKRHHRVKLSRGDCLQQPGWQNLTAFRRGQK